MADVLDLQSKFSNVCFLGEGGFGRVYRGCYKSTGQTYALKVLPLSSAIAEIEALCQLPVHQHIIGYHQCMILNGGRICLVMEYCQGGNLNDFLLKYGPEPARDLRFMREIASAVAFLHSQGVIHRDLKPDNILLTASGTLKVADFGLAKIASNFQQGGNLYKYYMESCCGTKLFLAPEIFVGHYTESADVFTMGAVFVCIVAPKVIQDGSGRKLVVPYFTWSPTNPVGVIGLGEALYIGQLSCFKLGEDLNISPNLRALVETMLATSYASRPTASQVVQCLAIG